MKSTLATFAIAALSYVFYAAPATACGGLFCQNVPVDQAGEQILFHQEGEYVTAMVRILYEGDSENFSWVVPVPTTPELSTGADAMFDELERLTRPQFILDRTGSACDSDFADGGSTGGPVFSVAAESDSGGVTIEQSLSVGPFAIEIVSSTDAGEMAAWLETNDYDLSDRGRQLIAPYVDAGMKFVAVKLLSGQSSGSIQPLIMKYKSDMPMVPIKLTAVAAQDDMGVLVWLVSGARAVPNNYLHVVPNYTQLNWYTGSQNAYASYQGLITTAMDEAGGQGFATDFAGTITDDITNFMTSADSLTAELGLLDQLQNDNEFLANLYSGLRTDGFRNAFQAYLPLPQGQDESIYFDQFALLASYSAEELSQARINARQAFIDIEIDPLTNSTALIPNGRYLTRLYTTLSADEMTLDPSFEFNPDMPQQARERRATLDLTCGNEGTEWSLTLGEGTGREGEKVISAKMQTPTTLPAAATTQRAVFSTAVTSGDALPVIQKLNEFEPLTLNANGEQETTEEEGSEQGSGEQEIAAMDEKDSKKWYAGSLSTGWICLISCMLFLRRRVSEL